MPYNVTSHIGKRKNIMTTFNYAVMLGTVKLGVYASFEEADKQLESIIDWMKLRKTAAIRYYDDSENDESYYEVALLLPNGKYAPLERYEVIVTASQALPETSYINYLNN